MSNSSGKKTIAHNPGLIPRYVGEHQELLTIFTQIVDASDAGQPKGIARNLELFKQKFLDHIMDENFHLYLYLRQILKPDDESHELMRIYQKEMAEIRRDVLRFVDAHLGNDAEYGADFHSQLLSVGAALKRRIDAEEDKLYPLYRSSESFKQAVM